jgi:hypothetical protein
MVFVWLIAFFLVVTLIVLVIFQVRTAAVPPPLVPAPDRSGSGSAAPPGSRCDLALGLSPQKFWRNFRLRIYMLFESVFCNCSGGFGRLVTPNCEFGILVG